MSAVLDLLTTARAALAQPDRSLVIGFVAAFLLVGAALWREERVLKRTGGTGIVAFALASTVTRSSEIIQRWGDRGTVAAARSLLLDYLWLVAYGALLVMGALWVEPLGERASQVSRSLAAVAPWMALAGVGAALLDAVENTALLRQLARTPSPVSVAVASGSARLKFAIIIVVLVYLLVGAAAHLMLA